MRVLSKEVTSSKPSLRKKDGAVKCRVDWKGAKERREISRWCDSVK